MPGFPEGSVDLPTAPPGTIVTPDMGGAPTDDLNTLTKPGAPALSPTAQQAFGNVLAYGLPGIGTGLLDTLGQSLRIFNNSDVPDFLKAHAGSGDQSFGDFYSRNQQPLRTGGEITGMFIPGLAAMKILKTVRFAREAGQLGEVLQGARSLDILLGSSAELSAAEARVAQAAMEGSASQGIWAGRTITTAAMTSAKNSYYAARALDAARTTVAFELGNRIAFNSSDTFYPADYTLTDQLKWGGVALVAGIGLEMLQAKYATRQLVQTAINLQKAQVPLSPFAKNISDVIFRPNDRGVGVTQFAALNADLSNLVKTSSNATLQTNLNQDLVNIKGVLAKQIGNMAYDTHPILPRTTLSNDQIDLGLKVLNSNNTAFLWANKLSTVPEGGAQDFYSELQDTLNKAVSRHTVDTSSIVAKDDPAKIAAADAVLAPIQNAASEVHYVIENDGRFSTYLNRADNWLDTHSFGEIKPSTYNQQVLDRNGQQITTKNLKLTFKANNTIVLHDNFRLEIPNGATPMDYSAVYAAGSKFIQNYKPVPGQQFILTPQVNWRTLEGTLALASAKPEVQNAITLGEGFNSLDDVRFHVLNQKFQEFNRLMNITERRPLSSFAARLQARTASSESNYTPAQVLQRLNLPEFVGTQPSPLIETFAHARLQNMNSLYDMFPVTRSSLQPSNYTAMDLLQAHLRETADITDSAVTIPVSGNLLKQNDVRPIFVAATATPMLARNDEMIAGLVQAKRDVQLERLAKIDPKNAPLVSGVINKIVTGNSAIVRPGGVTGNYTGVAEGGDLSGAANQARAVQSLQDGLVSGQGQIVYQDRINEQFPTLKATQLLAQNTDKYVDNYVMELANVDLAPRVASILSPKNKDQLLDFNRIEQAYRHGWDIKAVVPSPDGEANSVVFALNPDSPINKQLMEYHFGSADIDAEEITHLPDMSVTALRQGYRPLVVHQNAADLASSISSMSRMSGRENNALRLALGNRPIQIRDFHLPTPELSRTGTWFVRNDVGNVIATYTGDLEASNRTRALAAAQQLSDRIGANHIAVPLETVQRDHAIYDDNFFDVVDYSDQLIKSGANITGGLAHTEIDTSPTTLKAMVQSLQQQFLNIGIRARAAIFEPELNYARQAAANTTRDNLGKFNIFDRYVATMFSRAPTNSQGTFGQIYGGIEGGLDRALSWLNAYHTELTGSTDNGVGAKAMRTLLRKQSSEEEFRQFAQQLPEWSPFKSATDWAESTFHEKMPWTTRPIMSKLSQISSTLSLRFLDVGTAINNFAGLMTNAPSVVMHLRKSPTETNSQWLDRTAAWGSQIGEGIITFSPMKAMATSSRAYWNGELTAAMNDAATHGYFKPEYSALANVLANPTRSRTGKAIDDFTQAASYLADHSEIMSRKLAWGMGYKIGKDLHGFKDERNAYIFANNFVNDMIGNYSPNNKPAMFQGAVGLPLGAFQTYMFNFYRRMFGMVERGDKAALIAQYAAQSSLFGVRSVPGYGLWNNYLQSDSQGADTFTNRVQRSFSPLASDLLLNGSLSNIPRIFGTDKGLAFYSRGSVDMTDIPPTILDWQRAPPIQFLSNTAAAITATVNNIFANGSFSLQQQEEILARFSTNRALKSIMETAAGVKTDRSGQVVDGSVRDAIDIAGKLLGTQTTYSRNLQDVYNQNQSVVLTQEALRATLNDKTRAIMRGNEFDVSTLQDLVHSYLKDGGNPAYVGQWFKQMFTTSMTPKALTRMEELGRSGKLLEFEDMLAAIQQNQTPQK